MVDLTQFEGETWEVGCPHCDDFDGCATCGNSGAVAVCRFAKVEPLIAEVKRLREALTAIQNEVDKGETDKAVEIFAWISRIARTALATGETE